MGGIFVLEEPEDETCPACAGKGELFCTTCYGTGGDASMGCPTCAGTGRKKCPICHGSGKF